MTLCHDSDYEAHNQYVNDVITREKKVKHYNIHATCICFSIKENTTNFHFKIHLKQFKNFKIVLNVILTGIFASNCHPPI